MSYVAATLMFVAPLSDCHAFRDNVQDVDACKTSGACKGHLKPQRMSNVKDGLDGFACIAMCCCRSCEVEENYRSLTIRVCSPAHSSADEATWQKCPTLLTLQQNGKLSRLSRALIGKSVLCGSFKRDLKRSAANSLRTMSESNTLFLVKPKVIPGHLSNKLRSCSVDMLGTRVRVCL
eukprot:4590808-Amphidinium_carterae.1